MIYDLIIIGAGPAGITASVYAARKKMKFLTISLDIGGQAAWSGDVENYTGYQFITGPELAMKFEDHLRHYGIELKEKEEVLEVAKKGAVISVKTDKGSYEAKTVIIASGKISRELGVSGEKEFKNKGLTYCATCDGPIFSGKDVAVVGGGNSALDAALQLLRIASRVYIINNTQALGGDEVMREKVLSNPSATVLNSSQVTAITGDGMVSGVRIKSSGKDELIRVQGIFVEIGLIPNSGFAKDVLKNSGGEIVVNCRNETNVPGIFAAGDVTDVPEKQIIIAAGEGSKATLAAFRYLNKIK
ncbi:MAG: FAD-dependent oxidoreductase [Candidatus Omnitrophica bacterium]|nr:FAD-dependent oxidoreductase [Candidatus Omnitrophota bacterium]